MEKLNSLNTSTVEQAVKQAVGYLRTWTQSELGNLIDRHLVAHKMPLIVKCADKGYLVGNYFAERVNTWWKLKYRFSDEEIIFSSKLSAVSYAVCMQTGKIKSADAILQDDDEVGRLTVKTEQFQQRLKQALKKKNTEKIDLYLTRYQDSALKLSLSRSHLEKTLKSAKYIKF